MKTLRSKSTMVILACTAVGSFLLGRAPAAPAPDAPMDDTIPSTQPAAPARTAQEIGSDYMKTSQQVAKLLPPKVLGDTEQRATAAPKAIPVLYHRIELIDELAETKKVPPTSISMMKQNSQALLYLLGDAPTVTKVKSMLDSSDASRKLGGQSIDVYSQWLGAGTDSEKATKAVDALEKLDRANPAESRLSMLTLNMAQTSPAPELQKRLLGLVTDVMTDPLAMQVKKQIKGQQDAAAKQEQMVGKPLTIAAKTVDGNDFTTANWKGKVILVDFWATWCGPCKASLPHVKEIYTQYHDKGLELVGISNDQDIKALKDFTPKNNMPWPQLFDADAAASGKWNPLSMEYGVNAIPCMFLIDKQGILRSVTARADMDTLIPKLLAESGTATQPAN